MPRLNELSLPKIDIFDPGYARDPHGAYRRARESGHWMAQYQFGYIPLDYEAVRFFMRADEQCRTPNRDITMMWKAQGTTFARFNDHQLMALGGAAHDRLRRLVAPAFTPKEANIHRELMRNTIRDIVAPVLAQGECDFVKLASRYPITVICRLIGVAAQDIEKFEGWVDRMGDAFSMDPSIVGLLNEITGNLFEYIDGVITARKASGGKTADLLQSLLDLTEGGDALTVEEVRVMLILLLGGGYDTTKNQLVLILHLMTQHPEYWKRVVDEPGFVKPLIEECLRFLNPIGSTHRVTNVEIEYRGVTIPANTFITLSQAVPGRDPKVNDDPERFDPDRRNPAHLTFGQGMHLCLGMFIARALLEEALPILARALLEPQVNGELRFRSPMAVWGLYTLPIRFTPGVA